MTFVVGDNVGGSVGFDVGLGVSGDDTGGGLLSLSSLSSLPSSGSVFLSLLTPSPPSTTPLSCCWSLSFFSIIIHA